MKHALNIIAVALAFALTFAVGALTMFLALS